MPVAQMCNKIQPHGSFTVKLNGIHLKQMCSFKIPSSECSSVWKEQFSSPITHRSTGI